MTPSIPRSTAALRPGQFWSIPLRDGRFGCGRVLGVVPRGRTWFIGALLDWVGDAPPTAEAIAGAPVLEVGNAHIRTIGFDGGAILGERPLDADGIVVPSVLDSYWGDGYAVARAEHRFIAGDPPGDDFRQITSPMTDEMVRPATSERGVVQFDRLPANDELHRLGEWFAAHPGFTLRAYGSYDGSIRDLEFLRFFPTLRHLSVDAMWDSLASLDGLRHLPADLESLVVGETRARLDLAPLARFGELRTLYLEGQTRGIDVISGLRALDDLTLRSITLPDLSLLLPLTGLRSLDLKLGGTRELALLPRIGQLRYLELWMIKGLRDLSAIAGVETLRSLFLQALPQVRALPDLSRLASLRRIHLETMKGLTDLSPLASAPALEEVLLLDQRQLTPDDLRPLVGLPRLRAVTPGLGSLRKNDAASQLLGLPVVRDAFDWRAD